MLEGGILDLIGLFVRRPWVFSGRIHTLKNARPFGFSNFLGSFGRCVFRAEAMAGLQWVRKSANCRIHPHERAETVRDGSLLGTAHDAVAGCLFSRSEQR